jgi:hypothetical protein
MPILQKSFYYTHVYDIQNFGTCKLNDKFGESGFLPEPTASAIIHPTI